ncbi:MAG TPA: VOC family protein [Streptosporangiaceae bacterium]|nr:VOC family protein [Streptosporangiaceae bacterium]
MTPAVQEMVAATYVRDIDVSRGFYELLGFAEDSSGRAATSGWSALHQGNYLVLLASTKPPLGVPQLPLLFYFYFDDVDAVIDGLRAGGVDVHHMGHPPHALGGEAKVLDPDGNTVLLGQRERSASQQQQPDDSSPHFSLLKEAAALVSARGGAKTRCQVNEVGGKPCRQRADVKLADAAGDSVWACLDHADEILVTVRGAFIASQADEGMASYLARRRS